MHQEQNIEDGFSSNSDQVQQQQLSPYRHNVVGRDTEQTQGERLRIPSPQKIREQVYSLNPDIETGWNFKRQMPKPVPLLHQNPFIDPLIQKIIKEAKQKAKLVYLGPRYPTTYQAWLQKQFQNPYPHLSRPHNIKITTRQFCGNRSDTQTCLLFDAEIESGNLDAAVRIGPKQYELFLRVDSNTIGHIQWFNFTVKSMKKDEKYTFHICNFQKHNSLYSRGSKPYIYSFSRFREEQIGWEQEGQSVKYDKKVPKSATVVNFQINPSYRLSFTYQCNYDNDVVQMAYCVPYTYTQLTQFLQCLEQSEKRNYLKIGKLCTSLGGLEVPLLTINERSAIEEKRCIIISGRAHPGESNGSYMMQGFISFLCSSCSFAKNLRKSIIFKIVPMLNPDGVALGNYRTGLSGKDFNRQFRTPDKKIFPEVFQIKKLVEHNKSEFKDNLLMFLDFHGHSVKKNVFMYGPEFSLTHKYYSDCRIFPKMLGDITSMFRYYSCMFKISESKVTTARAIVLRNFKIPFTYTIQASNGSYYDHSELKDVPFSPKSWFQMGQKICEALSEYIDLINQNQSFKRKIHNRKQKKQRKFSIQQVPPLKKYEQYRTKNRRTIYNDYSQDLTSGEETKMQKLTHQLNKLDQIKEEEENSEDDLKEGSSDHQDETDDLDKTKLKALYKMLKKKCPNNLAYNDKDLNSFLNDYDYGSDLFWSRSKKKQRRFNDELSYRANISSHKAKERRNSFTDRRTPDDKLDLMKIKGIRKVSFGSSFLGFELRNQPNTERLKKSHLDFLSSKESSKLKKEGYLVKNSKFKSQKSVDLVKKQLELEQRLKKKKYQPFPQ